MGGRYMPHAPPIVGRYGKRPHSRMRRLQLRTVHDLISSPRAFAGRAAPKERLVDSAGVPAPRLTARGAQTLLGVSSSAAPPRFPAAIAVSPRVEFAQPILAERIERQAFGLERANLGLGSVELDERPFALGQ